jgi:glycerophosphoryl diester phosphodiesterase
VFEAVGHQAPINVELTNYASVTDRCRRKSPSWYRHLKRRVLFSFFPIALLRVRRQVPEAPIGLLAFEGKSGALARSRLGALLGYQALHPEAGDVTSELVEVAHRRGCRLHTYTVNREDDLRRLFGLGVDGVFTDDPVLARRVLMSLRENAS